MMSTQPAAQKAYFESCAKSFEKSAVQHSKITVLMKNLFYLIL